MHDGVAARPHPHAHPPLSPLSSGTTKNVYDFPPPPFPGTFSSVAGSGFNVAGQGINGAAVAPVCGVQVVGGCGAFGTLC